jgi:probable addiction module antidote protein
MSTRKTGRTTRKSPSLKAADHRDPPKMIANFLNDALATGDTIAFVKAIGDLIRAQGMTKVSRDTGLNRSTLYISFEGNMMPNIDRVIRTLAALQLEIVVKPISRS